MTAPTRLLLAFIALQNLASFVTSKHYIPTATELDEAFNASILPCDDIHFHTCNLKQKAIEQYRNVAQYLNMAYDIVEVMDLTDPVVVAFFEEIAKINEGKCERPKIDDAPEGAEDFAKHLGRMYATGGCYYGPCLDPLYLICDIRPVGPQCQISTDSYGFLNRFKHNHSEVENPFVKNLLYGYLNALEVSNEEIDRYAVLYSSNSTDLDRLRNTSEYFQVHYMSDRWWDDWESHVRNYQLNSTDANHKWHNVRWIFFKLSIERLFAPYFNILLTKVMFENPDKFKVSYMDDMDNLAEAVKEGINVEVDKWPHFNSKQKEEVRKFLKRLNIIMGVEKTFRNLTYLQNLHERFQQYILKDLSSNGCNLKTIISRISIFRNQLVLKDEPLISPFAYHTTETSIFGYGGVTNGFSVYIPPGSIYPLQQNFPLGFKYGYTAWVIGHEIFHSLGPRKRKGHMAGITNHSHFDEAVQCYDDYYSSFCLFDKTGKKICPDGTRTSNEGFADVEGARHVFAVFKKALKQREDDAAGGTKHKRASNERRLPLFDSPPVEEFFSDGGNTFAEEKWFYKGLALTSCSHNNTETSVGYTHPRSGIRINAVARQTKSFSKVFGCKKGDPNFTTERICIAYPISEDYPEFREPATASAPENRSATQQAETVSGISRDREEADKNSQDPDSVEGGGSIEDPYSSASDLTLASFLVALIFFYF
ncbi:hypothetical protein L596_018123 [Steinernema carpocapsae]|uniref:Peptidase M13 C-terminal domain-containing protein n=1 Tax=Steinernema carpocapsae TaxID=34508 RepID=A0A4V6A1X8_STECR|nr:hypothetical protein L596_018123 [Steinernema carpocapsae]